MTLGEKIQELRRRSGMSQDLLAEKLEVSRQAVSKWERDEASPETDKIVRIAQVFGVSTDYLLLEAPSQSQSIPPQEQPRGRSAGDRIERFVRRHGYKAGYVMIGIGTLLCLIALLVMALLPSIGSSLFDSAKTDQNNWNSGVYVEEDVPVLDAIWGQTDSGFGDSVFEDMVNSYNQQIDEMNQAWSGSVQIIAMLFGIPVLAVGITFIVVGVIIVRKGKKIAAETQ